MAPAVVVGTILAYFVAWIVGSCRDKYPPIRDYDKYNKESISMTQDEIKKAMKEGRWS